MVRAWQLRESPGANGTLFSLSDNESNLLRLLDSSDRPLSAREIAISLHMPAVTADNLIVRMASLGIVDFIYNGNGEFVIARTRDD
jgi:hypothetical protein